MENKFTLANIKRHAKRVKKEKGIKHIEALELIAREHGYHNWIDCQNDLKGK